MLGKIPGGSLLANLSVGVLTVLVLAGIALPPLLSRSAALQDAAAQELLLNAATRMKACASLEGGGSFTNCDAEEMRSAESGIEWRDGVAAHGWGKDRVGKVYVSRLGETTYRLETTSASGRVFGYVYEGGVVTRTAGGGGQAGGW